LKKNTNKIGQTISFPPHPSKNFPPKPVLPPMAPTGTDSYFYIGFSCYFN
jgi:hypothetical protein